MTLQWEKDLDDWVSAWNAVRGAEAPEQNVIAWDGEVPAEDGLVLVCPEDQVVAARGAAEAQEKDVAAQDILLSGAVQELDRGLGFPGESAMFDAPMGECTRFEVDEWGTPVAHSTLCVKGQVAYMGPLLADGSIERDPAEVLDPLASSMANEAFLADAERMYTVVSQDEVAAYESLGWERAAAVLRLG